MDVKTKKDREVWGHRHMVRIGEVLCLQNMEERKEGGKRTVSATKNEMRRNRIIKIRKERLDNIEAVQIKII